MHPFSTQNIYTSCSTNRSPNIVTWGDNGFVYYGSCNSIAVYDLKDSQRVLHTCCAHKDEVRCVRWIKECGDSSQPLLLSASSDTTAIVWSISKDMGLIVQASLQGHAGAVTAADGLQQKSENGAINTFVVTTSVDMTVKVWKNNSESFNEFSCVQTLRTGSGFCLDVRLHALPCTSVPLLACALDDFKIGLYVWESDNFQKKEALSGHEDWVCCLDWTTL
ncbi:hypothetical protein B566_EDAN007145, partial [Ephemera danica]